MSHFALRTVLPSIVRLALGMTLSLALLAGLLPASGGVPSARAEQGGTSVPAVGTKLEEAKDIKGVLQLWNNGGPVTKAAAKAALLGNEAQLNEFISTGQYTAMQQDFRTAVIQLTLVGRASTRETAENALADGSWKTLQSFLAEGWTRAWLQDDLVATSSAASSGTPTVKEAAQRALKAGDSAVQSFMTKDKADAEFIDKQMAVGALLKSSRSVKLAANAALNVNTVEALDDFLRYGQFVAAARDAETATVTQLANQARSASLQAIELNQGAQAAADQAAQAAKLAKEAAQRAASEAAAAKDSASRAGSAAMRAASLADQAARAAQVAVNAAQDARAALGQAANAATNAAAAAARAEQAAAGAQSAASAAAGDAQLAAAARTAAQNARDAAAGARKAAEAAGFAADSTNASKNAADSAKSAGRNAAAAAAAASAAASESGVSDAEAAQASAAAARADAAAKRAEKASAQVDSLSRQASDTAIVAQKAALDAAQHAENAAANAEEAANQAGNAATAVDRAKKYAAAAQDAAVAATAAVDKAIQVRNLARQADADRLAAEREFKMAQARDDLTLEESKRQAKAEAEQQTAAAAATAGSLIARLSAPGNDLNAQLKDVKTAIVGVMESGGPWQKASAQLAIVGSPELMKEFIVNGLATSREQDDWDQTVQAMYNSSDKVAVGAYEVLGAGPTVVSEFLATDRWTLKLDEDRIEVSKYLSAKGSAVKQAASAALNADSPAAFQKFLNTDRFAAAALDRREEITAMRKDAGPELKAAIDVALDGPDSRLATFLSSGQYEAKKRDQEAAAHITSIEGLITKAQADAATARAAAASAKEAVARAERSQAEADGYAADARKSAQEAKDSAATAAGYAKQAQDSADSAAQSAATARNAAVQARSDAQAAGAEAAKAAGSAAAARNSAASASMASDAAQQSALAAGKDADLAAQAASEAVEIAATKKREEALAQASTGGPGTTPSLSDIEAVRAANGDAAADELKNAKDTLAQGDVMDMIVREGGQLLLEFFGINDIVNCVTKGDFGACVMALIGVLPWGKLFKAAEAIGMIGKIAPKVIGFFTKRQDALRVVEKNAATVATGAGCAVNRASLYQAKRPEIYTSTFVIGAAPQTAGANIRLANSSACNIAGNISRLENLQKRTDLPGYRYNMIAGELFNFRNYGRFLPSQNEVRLYSNRIIDFYIPGAEIGSRKFTQLGVGGVQPKTALGYLQEIVRKYPIGAKLPDGKTTISGVHVLEVPVQKSEKFPQIVLDYAKDNKIMIRDDLGKVYFDPFS